MTTPDNAAGTIRFWNRSLQTKLPGHVAELPLIARGEVVNPTSILCDVEFRQRGGSDLAKRGEVVSKHDLDAFDCGIRFFRHHKSRIARESTVGNQHKGIRYDSFRFAPLRGDDWSQTVKLKGSFDPLAPEDDRRTFLDFKSQELVTHIRTTTGKVVKLESRASVDQHGRPDVGDEQRPRLVFSHKPYRTNDPARDAFYLVPRGRFEIHSVITLESAGLADEADNGPWELLLGNSGTEYVTVGKGSSVTFSKGPAFYVPSSDPTNRNLRTAGEGLLFGEEISTSFLSFDQGEKKRAVPQYFSQPDDAPLFSPTLADRNLEVPIFNFRPLPLRDLSNESSFPVGFAEGFGPAMGPRETPHTIEDYNELEPTILNPERRRLISKTKRSSSPASTFSTSDSVTPQGIKVVLEGNKYEKLILAKSEPRNKTNRAEKQQLPTLKFEKVHKNTSLLEALQCNKLFLVMTRPPRDVDFHDLVGIRGWTFKVNLEDEGRDLKAFAGPLFILKYYDKPINELVEDTELWQKGDWLPSDHAELRDVQDYLRDYIADSRKKAQTQATSEYYRNIDAVLHNKHWNGILATDVTIFPQGLPEEILWLLSGDIDQEKFKAHHLGAAISKCNVVDGGIDIDRTSLFALIDYEDHSPLVIKDNFKHKLRILKLLFLNSAIKAFVCEVDFGVKKIFSQSVNNDNRIIRIKGTYETRGEAPNEQDVYTFLYEANEQQKYHPLGCDNQFIKEIGVHKLQVLTTAASDTKSDSTRDINLRFAIYGHLTMGDTANRFLCVEKLAFSDLGVDASFKLITNNNGKFTIADEDFSFRPGLMRLDMSKRETCGANKLLEKLPLKLRRLYFAADPKQNSKLDWGELAFFPVWRANGTFDYGLSFDLDLGSLGELSSKLKGFKAELLLGWNIEKPSEIHVGIRPPDGKLEIGIEGVIKLIVERFNICEPDQHDPYYAILMQDSRVELLGKPYPDPEKAKLDVFLFADPKKLANGKIGWWGAYEEEDFYLGLGQHLQITAQESSNFDRLLRHLKLNFPKSDSGTSPCDLLDEYKTFKYSEANKWSVGLEFTIEKLATLGIVFNDPHLYGLKVDIVDLIELQVLYRKITDEIGVYSSEIALPLPPLQFGTGSLTWPAVGFELFTNGDWKVDIGFPWNRDFSRSCTLQIIIVWPWIGGGGIYCGKLSGTTSNLFDSDKYPLVAVLGIGMRVGVGIEGTAGILRYGVSVCAYGILEGALAYEKNSAMELLSPDQFRVDGRVGVLAQLYGEVDFGVIKALVSIVIDIGLPFSIYKSNGAVTFCLEAIVADVRVSAKLKIKLGFIKITIRFSFNMHLEIPLMDCGGRLLSSVRTATPIAWKPSVRCLQYAERDKTQFDVFFLPTLTVTPSDNDKNQPHVIAGLGISSDNFETLCEALWSYALERHFADRHTATAVTNELRVTTEDLSLLSARLSSLKELATGDDAWSYERITEELKAHFHVRLVGAKEFSGVSENLVFFPMIPELVLQAHEMEDVDFHNHTLCDEHYEDLLDKTFEDMFIRYSSEPRVKHVARSGSDSFSKLTFEQYFHCIQLAVNDSMCHTLKSLGSSATVGELVERASKTNRYEHIAGIVTDTFYSGLRLPHPKVAKFESKKKCYLKQSVESLSRSSGISASFGTGDGSHSVSCWLRPRQQRTGDYGLVAGFFWSEKSGAESHQAANPKPTWTLDLAGQVGSLKVGLSRRNADDELETCESLLTANVWHHVVAVNDDDSTRLYVNGVEVTSEAQKIPENKAEAWPKKQDILGKDSDEIFCVGGCQGRVLDGEISGIALWSDALGLEEVKYLYNCGYPIRYRQLWNNTEAERLGLHRRPIAWWELDEESGDRADSHFATEHSSLCEDGGPDEGGIVPFAHGLIRHEELHGFYELTGQQVKLDSWNSDFPMELHEVESTPEWFEIEANEELSPSFESIPDKDLPDLITANLPSSCELLRRYVKRDPSNDYIGELSPLGSSTRNFGFGESFTWKVTSKSAEKLIWPFSDEFRSGLLEGRGFDFCRAQLFRDSEGRQRDQTLPAVHGDWGTQISLTIRRVPNHSATGHGRTLLGQGEWLRRIYEIGGMNASNRVLLEQILRADLELVDLSLLYRDVSGKEKPLFYSDSLSIDSDCGVAVIKTNVSTESRPSPIRVTTIQGTHIIKDDDVIYSASLSDKEGFLRLLWECSVVNSGGYYLRYMTQAGDDDRLFTQFEDSKSDQIELKLLIRGTANTEEIPSGYHNCLLTATEVEESFSTSSQRLRATSRVAEPKPIVYANLEVSIDGENYHRLQAHDPAMETGCFGYHFDRDRHYPEDESAEYRLDNTYSKLAPRIKTKHTEPGIRKIPHVLPVTPQSEQQVDIESGEPMIDEFGEPVADERQWYYEQILPLYDDDNSGIDSLVNTYAARYASIGKDVDVEFEYRDVFGNRAPLGTLSITDISYSKIVIEGETSIKKGDELTVTRTLGGKNGTYDISGPFTAGDGIEIVIADAIANTFQVEKDHSSLFTKGVRIEVKGSAQNDRRYRVMSNASYDGEKDLTSIPVEDVEDGAAGGSIFCKTQIPITEGEIKNPGGVITSKPTKGFKIFGVDIKSKAFIVEGDLSSLLSKGAYFTVEDSPKNDGLYVVEGTKFSAKKNYTAITVEKGVRDSKVGGVIYPIKEYLPISMSLDAIEVSCDETDAFFGKPMFEIANASVDASMFEINGNQSSVFAKDSVFRVEGSKANDGRYKVISASKYDSEKEVTLVQVGKGQIQESASDGFIRCPRSNVRVVSTDNNDGVFRVTSDPLYSKDVSIVPVERIVSPGNEGLICLDDWSLKVMPKYFDRLIGVSEWPSVTCNVAALTQDAEDENCELVVELRFPEKANLSLSFTIAEADSLAHTFSIGGDHSGTFVEGTSFRVTNADGNEGKYTSRGSVHKGGFTFISVAKVGKTNQSGTIYLRDELERRFEVVEAQLADIKQRFDESWKPKPQDPSAYSDENRGAWIITSLNNRETFKNPSCIDELVDFVANVSKQLKKDVNDREAVYKRITVPIDNQQLTPGAFFEFDVSLVIRRVGGDDLFAKYAEPWWTAGKTEVFEPARSVKTRMATPDGEARPRKTVSILRANASDDTILVEGDYRAVFARGKRFVIDQSSDVDGPYEAVRDATHRMGRTTIYVENIVKDSTNGVIQVVDETVAAQSFSEFVENFEDKIFESHKLRLATGSKAEGSRSLWVVRGDNLELTTKQARQFAPTPLCTSLMSGTAKIVDPAEDINAADPNYWTRRTFDSDFTDVDLDKHAKEVFALVEQVLSPQVVGNIACLRDSGGQRFTDRIASFKREIASHLATKVIKPVFTHTGGGTDSLKHLEKAYEQRMLINLDAAYGIDSMLEIPVSATMDLLSDEREVNFFGEVLLASSISSDGKELEDENDKSVELGVAKLRFKKQKGSNTVNSTLAVMVDAKRADSQPYFEEELVYRVSHIEHDIPGEEERYRSSRWLNLVRPIHVPLSKDKILMPIPVREFPAPPQVLRHQEGESSFLQGIEMRTLDDIHEACKWDYEVVYQAEALPQDDITAKIRLNQRPEQRMLTDHGLQKLFQALVSFRVGFGEPEELLKLLRTSEGELKGKRKAVLQNFAEHLREVAEAISEFTRNRFFDSSRKDDELEYQIKEWIVNPGHRVLCVCWADNSDQPDAVVYKPSQFNEVSDSDFCDHAGHTCVKRNAFGEDDDSIWRERVLRIKGLNVLKQENAKGGLLVNRNKTLSPTSQSFKVNSSFVYTTDYVWLPDPLTPYIEHGNELPLRPVKDGKIEDYVKQVFKRLFEDQKITSGTRRVKIQSLYGLTLWQAGDQEVDSADGEIAVFSPFNLALPEQYKVTDPEVAEPLNGKAESWHEVARPLSNDLAGERPRIAFDVTVFASLGEIEMPVLRLKRVTIGMESIMWSQN